MDIIKRPTAADPARYSATHTPNEALYGLPNEILYCRNCTYSNQKPNSAVEYKHKPGTKKSTLGFDESGLCVACQYAKQKKAEIDWAEREKELLDLCARFRRADGKYDCLVPGSGGKDSFYAAHVLKYKYKMNPLTVTWAPHMHTEWGWKNFQAWIHAGFDNYLFTPNGRVHRLLTRLATETIGHPFQPFMLGQYYFVAKMAAEFGLPLVFYGENAAEYGNPAEENTKATKDTKYFATEDRRDIYIAGVSVGDLQEQFGLTSNDLDVYLPPAPQLIENNKIEVHQLGYYLKWHPQSNYYYAVEHGGFQASPERTSGSYSKYSSIDDKIDDLHYYTTFLKFGIGRATYDSAQEVRSGEITREEGIALIRRYDGEYPVRFEKELLHYLSVREKENPQAYSMFEQGEVDQEYFRNLCDRLRSPHLWKLENGEWKLRKPIWEEATTKPVMASNRTSTELSAGDAI